MSNLGYIQMSLKDPLLSVSLFCHLASIILCALILSETMALYKSFTYLLTYSTNVAKHTFDDQWLTSAMPAATMLFQTVSETAVACWTDVTDDQTLVSSRYGTRCSGQPSDVKSMAMNSVSVSTITLCASPAAASQ